MGDTTAYYIKKPKEKKKASIKEILV